MSAIGGIFYRNENIIPSEIADNFMNKLGKYNYDDKGQWSNNNVFLGCFMNWVTPESVNEKLPFHYKNRNLTITADAIIDNREELFEKLDISRDDRSTITDSMLILKAYEKWDEECPKFLIGDFSFAIWDEEKKSLFCARDHVGKRTLYYSMVNNIFAFSTLIKPLLQIPGVSSELDKEWLGVFLLTTPIRASIDPESTSYSSVRQLLPAHTMTIDSNGVKFQKYWEIKKGSTLYLKSDEEYEEAFRKVFSEAVRCRMRSIGEVGVMMSGGLDSGSIACIASQEFKKKGGILQAFSHVPLKGYNNSLPKSRIGDETPYINAIKDYCGNIDVNFCRVPEKNSYNVIDNRIDIFEQPFKTVQNAYWIEGIMEEAKYKNISVLLDGQSGNATISWGEFISGCLTFLEEGDMKTLKTEVREYSKTHNVNSTRLLISILKNYLPLAILRAITYPKVDILSHINKEFAKETNLIQRFKKSKHNPSIFRRTSSFGIRSNMLSPAALSNTGAYETKVSLAYGVCRRDPTRDKRVIEFCMSLPENQYIRNGRERQLIRKSMKAIVPDKVRLNESIRGVQAADWVERIVPIWPEIRNEYLKILNDPKGNKYMDIKRGLAYIKKLDDELDESIESMRELRIIMRSIIFMKFINKGSIEK